MSSNSESNNEAAPLPRSSHRWATISAIRARTMIIALCALGTSLWQGYTIQKHNRLMVQPILDEEINTDADGRWESYVLNSGLGPAKVLRVDYRVDGKAVEGLSDALKALGEPAECYGTGSLVHFYRVNQRQQVLRTLDKRCAKTSEELKLLLSRLQLTLHYESLYGDKAVLNMFGPEASAP
ncbi:hypothetical protein LNV08_10540 [Paucibacter sp. TC2R-5]|uniref:hypothetical protein n=1 Tax=Paucibacter sp. TC2R-5 TaxID=2893555 RepID=UPI0021E401CE|nr:hypothetical protein [Paucibacter sp. TC2R-5]MCV2359411.1 hypothetical protein [Paucibacter sp. TC2R-5]